jgi:hypothetical protein
MGRFLPFKQAGVLDKHDDQVFCGIFSKDGTLFLSACQGCVVYLTKKIIQNLSQLHFSFFCSLSSSIPLGDSLSLSCS